ncbi:zinc finger A20 and AN1 domain-containing stress-associated protein 4 [Lactuca sativa]|uniref:Zinc finger A20 and AN1 domain-containing stress-associated protein 4 n=1 Tax=Lactuca sativa TaxID=4236 RepID=A0A9R1UKK7_LACSA|nr:zinc finger A20 and AN1 domain-containing stress-associated protein 4 [Lactuca sativa]KAJ0188864.1 hypothetical protein LSAT_V11C900474720 [Lactuca sativa]
MAEEQEWHEASNHVLCANNCGFFGSPTTLNLCSKCYKDHRLKEQHMSNAKLAVEKSLTPPQAPQQPPPPLETSSSSGTSVSLSVTTDLESGAVPPPPVAVEVVPIPKPQQRNRCGSCNRRVGLTGFTCKCGTTFCGTHRYPELHACSFDFKTIGKEAISKANPVIKAAKLNKI